MTDEVKPFRLVVCVRCAKVRLAGTRDWMTEALFDEVYTGDERTVDAIRSDGACPVHRGEQLLERDFESGDTVYQDGPPEEEEEGGQEGPS